jgi:plastocyanin
LTSSDPTIAQIDRSTGKIVPIRVGQVTFYATTFAYGVALQDSLAYTIGYPIKTQNNNIWIRKKIKIGSTQSEYFFDPQTLTIGVGGQVLWTNPFPAVLDVIFDDSLHVTGGNITPSDSLYTPLGGRTTDHFWRSTFPVVGTYTFHSNLYGISGTIIVKP